VFFVGNRTHRYFDGIFRYPRGSRAPPGAYIVGRAVVEVMLHREISGENDFSAFRFSGQMVE
jgi:hypothetical protein